jgi:tetratricopeptide (TPR) repeat protein
LAESLLPASRLGWLLGLLLVAATLIAYGPAWRAGYIWDDDAYLTQNPLLTAPDGLRRIWFSLESPSQYFPLTYTTFYLERALWGLNPAGYHLINILLHAANAVLVWRLLARLRVPGAWLAAAIFALHPVQVESAAWITERKNVLMGFFFLLTLWEWVRFIDEKTARPWRHYILALLFFALSLSAKTTACTLPAGLLLILWLKKMPVDLRRLVQVVPFVTMGAGMGLLSMWWERYHQGTQGSLFRMGPVERVLLACRALWFYAGKLIWPSNLAFSYPHWTISTSDPRAYGWVAATALLMVAICCARRWTGRGVEVALLFFAATLSPLLGFIMVYTFSYSFVADHYQYLACLGPIALAVAAMEIGWDRVKGWNSFLRPALYAAILVVLGTLTWQQCETYANSETLWRATLERNPNSWLAHNDLGTYLLDAGELDAALPHFQKALAINPNLAGAHHNIAAVLAQKGRVDEAIAEYRKALAIEPDFAKAQINFGAALMQKGEVDEAIAHFQKGLALSPHMANGHNSLAIALARKGRLTEAIAEFQKTLENEPETEEVRKNLGLAFAQNGQASQAITQFQRVLEINPNNIEACDHLAWLLATASEASLRDGGRAVALARHALELAGGDNPNVLRTLAAAYAETGDYKEAASAAGRAREFCVKYNNQPLAEKLQAEIKLYQAGAPVRAPAR